MVFLKEQSTTAITSRILGIAEIPSETLGEKVVLLHNSIQGTLVRRDFKVNDSGVGFSKGKHQ